MNLDGLSFENIPKFTTPLRFFATAPIFGLLASLLLIMPDVWLSRWQPQFIAMTHLFTLGFIAMIMFGALIQILPVLGGVGLPNVDKTAPIIHALFVGGVALFPLNFLFPSEWSVLASLFPLITAIGALVVCITWVLFKTNKGNVSIRAIRLALMSLFVTVISGVIQLSSYYYTDAMGLLQAVFQGKDLTNLHMAWGVLGWVVILIMGVSFQVIPMFHVTPDFKQGIKQWLPAIQFSLLVGMTTGIMYKLSIMVWLSMVFTGIVLLVYAYSGLGLLAHRKRKVPDSTVNFWKLAFSALIISIAVFCIASILPLIGLGHRAAEAQLLAVTVFIAGFVMSVILGMLIKIAPFLAYLHLQQSAMNCFQAMSALPNMHELLAPNLGKWLFKTYTITLPVLCIVPLVHELSVLAGLLLVSVFLQLLILQWKTWQVYNSAQQNVDALVEKHGVMNFDQF